MKNNTINLLKNGFYSLCVLLIAICAYLAELAVQPLRPYLAQKTTSSEQPKLTQAIQDLSLVTQDNLNTIIDVNYYGFFVLCVLASYLYFITQQTKTYWVALFCHFICLVICYFWASDMLYVFNKFYLIQSAPNMSVLLVASKMVIAMIFCTGFFVLVRSMLKNKAKVSEVD